MNQNPQEPELTTMRVHSDAHAALKKAESVHASKKKVRPTHSEAIIMASAAWVRELKAESQAAT